MTRTESVYVASKDGESRRFASPEPFSPWFLGVLHRDGFTVRRVDYEVPDGADSAQTGSAVELPR